MFIIFTVIQWYLSLFCQTFFHHRYSAHRMFRMSKFWEKVFFIFSFITQGSSYLSPSSYGILHRMHHAYTDTDKDPHSPTFDRIIFTMMWRTRNVYAAIGNNRMEIEPRFTKELPRWKWFDKFAETWWIRTIWITGYVGIYYALDTPWWGYFLLPVNIFTGPLHGAIINWFAHKIGYVNIKQKNTSKNLMVPDVLMLGEGFHNNHHKYPSNPNFGLRWYEIDPVYPEIKLFSWLGIVQLRKRISFART